MKYGLYSAEAARLFGSFYYKKPDGSQVEITCVCDTPDWDGYCWKDKVSVGEVVEYGWCGKATTGIWTLFDYLMEGF